MSKEGFLGKRRHITLAVPKKLEKLCGLEVT
jgi:hypothetical protein